MAREFKVGERLQIWDSAQRAYKCGVTVKRIVPDQKGTSADIIVIYDKPILGVRPTQTFRPGVLEDRLVTAPPMTKRAEQLTRREIAVIKHALRIAIEDGSLHDGSDLADAEVNREIESIRRKLDALAVRFT